jgi:hypothetical protein
MKRFSSTTLSGKCYLWACGLLEFLQHFGSIAFESWSRRDENHNQTNTPIEGQGTNGNQGIGIIESGPEMKVTREFCGKHLALVIWTLFCLLLALLGGRVG